MKNRCLFLGLLLFTLIAGCSGDREDTKSETDDVSTVSEQVVVSEDGYEEVFWDELTFEEKEEKILELGYLNIDFTIEQLVEELDELYANENHGYSQNFELAFNTAIINLGATAQLSISETVEQVGGNSFSEENHDIYKPLVRNVSEKDGKTYVAYGSNNSFYVSTLENNEWIKKDILVFDGTKQNVEKKYGVEYYFEKHTFVNNTLLNVYETSYDEHTIIVIEFDESGGISEKIIADKEKGIKTAGLLKTNDGGLSLWIKNSDNTMKIFEGTDMTKVLYEYSVEYGATDFYNSDKPYFLDREQGIVYQGDTEKISRIDVKTGGTFWDNQGKVVEWDIPYEYLEIIVDEKDLIITRKDSEEKTMSVKRVDSEFNELNPEVSYPIEGEQYSKPLLQTETEDEIHIWEEIIFKEKVAMRLVKISKGK